MFAKRRFCLPKFSGIVGRVEQPQWERLGEYVLARRKNRGWSQSAVAERGGPSDTLQSKIETGAWRPTRGVDETLKKIDAGLEWEVGSASRVLDGGEPLLVEHRLGRGLASLLPPYPEAEAREEVKEPVDHALHSKLRLWADQAKQIGSIGHKLLGSLIRSGQSDEVLADVALSLAQISIDLAEAIYSEVEDNPRLGSRFADAYGEAMISSRGFIGVHDQHVHDPAQHLGRKLDISMGTALPLNLSASDLDLAARRENAPKEDEPAE